MTAESKRKVQLVLVVALAVAAMRAGYFFYQRYFERAEQTTKQTPPLNPDYYVSPKKLYPYDLKSAKHLTQQPVWVKEGYRYTYYPYDPTRRRTDFSHEAGLLLPIQRLEIKDVVTDATPGSADHRQVMALFEQEGKPYTIPIGSLQGGNYHIYSDEIFYIQDPRELYKHWPPDIWEAIAQHQVKPGMNEYQADFAIGMGIPELSTNAAVKTVHYPNGGKPLTIIYRNGKAADIAAGPPAK
jgi:hypothetical protein